MNNYTIMSYDATKNFLATNEGRLLKLKTTSRNNISKKSGMAENEKVAQEIKEAAVGPKVKIQSFTAGVTVNEAMNPKKIKLGSAVLAVVTSKGIVVSGNALQATETPVVEETVAHVEEPKAEETKIPDYEVPNFNFEALNFGGPTSKPEDEKEVKGKLSDIHIPGFEDKKEEPEPVAEEKKEEPVVAEAPVEETKTEEEKTEEVKEETPAEVAPVEEPKAEEKKEEVKDSPDELAAQLKSAIDKQIEKATKEAEEKAKKNAEKEIEKAKAEAEKAKAEAAKAQEELEKTNVDLKKALKDLEAAKTENKSLAQEVSDANRYKEAVAQVIGEIGAPEVEATRQRAA